MTTPSKREEGVSPPRGSSYRAGGHLSNIPDAVNSDVEGPAKGTAMATIWAAEELGLLTEDVKPR